LPLQLCTVECCK